MSEENKENKPKREMIKPNLALLGLSLDPTIDDIVEDDDLDKLSPRLMVEPESLLAEEKGLRKADGLSMTKSLSIETELAKVCGPAHDLDNHYICSICFKVVVTPVECSKCNKAFCKECAEGW